MCSPCKVHAYAYAYTRILASGLRAISAFCIAWNIATGHDRCLSSVGALTTYKTICTHRHHCSCLHRYRCLRTIHASGGGVSASLDPSGMCVFIHEPLSWIPKGLRIHQESANISPTNARSYLLTSASCLSLSTEHAVCRHHLRDHTCIQLYAYVRYVPHDIHTCHMISAISSAHPPHASAPHARHL